MKAFFVSFVLVAISAACITSQPALAQQQALTVKLLAETKVTALPTGPLYWRLENFPTLAQAQAAAGPTALAVQSGGKVWLITLGPAGGASAGGTKVAEIGPIPSLVATQYDLRVNEASGPPGSITPEHSHPGSEAFYVISGESSSRTPAAVEKVAAGHGEPGHVADTPMQVSSTGSTDLLSLVMFILDANRPYSSPAKLP